MADTNIEWAEKVWNPVVGCNKVSQGCKNCYAEVMHRRLMKMKPEKYNRPFSDGAFPHEPSLNIPLKWKKPSKIFVNSMSDLFHQKVPNFFIDDVLDITLRTQHTFIILTKRPQRMLDYFLSTGNRAEYLMKNPNIWLGVSVEDQETADERIPFLLATRAKVKFISAEPLLGPINLKQIDSGIREHKPNHFDRDVNVLEEIEWVIVGGESGKNARPMHPDWVRSLRDQCKKNNVPFLFKQWGEFIHESQLGIDNNASKEFDKHYYKVGKKKAGRLLDGVLYDEYPKGISNENNSR
jgi:protein gp37